MRRKVIGILHLGLSLLGEKMERLLGQKDAEIERLRGQLEDERRDLDAARREADKTIGRIVRERDAAHALLSRLAPRTYHEGDLRPNQPFQWFGARRWVEVNWVNPGDIYLDLPPPDAWPQFSDPRNEAYVTQESDAARRDRSDAQDVVDVAAETLKTYIQDGEDIGDAIVRLWNERADLVEACRVHERERASLHARFVQSVQDNGAVADALLSSQRERDEAHAELARLREQTTPRIYKEGDRPKLPEMVLYRSKFAEPSIRSLADHKIHWAHLHRDCLLPGDYWLPMPPPPPPPSSKGGK